ncbi:MAG TPA: ABC transporter permease [Blastocatellia bacterium]|nr:ABC transporter permease [Blastocatellia bacterium]
METLAQDIRYGVRTLVKNPGFTIVAVIALALGIGANSAIFTVVNGVILRPLPYEDPEELVLVWETRPARNIMRGVFSPADFLDTRNQNQVFEDMAAFNGANITRTDGGEPERVRGNRVSHGFFSILGIQPALGRAFLPEDEKFGNHRVVILSHGYWQRRFAGDPDVIGKTLTLNSQPHTVIGILPAGFRFVWDSEEADMWLPLAFAEDKLARGSRYLPVIARLKPGVSREQAQAEMDALAASLEQQYPDSNAGRGVFVASMHEEIVGDIRLALYVLLAAVAFVLLIACANVANLLLARAAGRQREVALRLALGASRFRLVRQFLTESVLLSMFSGALGLVLALWGLDFLKAVSPGDIPRLNEIGLDFRALGFTLGISLLTGLLFGIAPALQASNLDLNEALKEGGRSATVGFRRQRLRSLFVVAEVALALVLLIGAGLLIRSFLRLQEVKPGFDPNNVLTMAISLPEARYPKPEQQAAFFRQLLENLETLPGVETVGAVLPLPYSHSNYSYTFDIEGRPSAAPGERTAASWRAVSPDYFRAMRIPLLKGRAFTEQDVRNAEKVIIINETMAQRYFPDEDPIGKRMTIGINNITARIVGIVGDVKFAGLDSELSPEMYTPYPQTTAGVMNIVMRTTGDPASVIAAARSQAQLLDRDLPVYDIKPMEERLSESVAQPRFNTLLLTIFAAVALALAVVGIYGVMSYSVTQRTHEIGIRMALGAGRGDVLRLVVGQGMALALVGVGVGLAGAYFLTRWLESLLFGVTATDPATFAAISLLLVAVALFASYIPARRATKVDPMVALRHE